MKKYSATFIHEQTAIDSSRIEMSRDYRTLYVYKKDKKTVKTYPATRYNRSVIGGVGRKIYMQ